MSKVIEGTEDYTGGAYSVPTGVDGGKDFSKLVTAFMKRMAVHSHQDVDSAQASLPTKTVNTITTVESDFTFDATTGVYTLGVTLVDGLTTLLKNLSYQYRATIDPDVNSNWTRFYPSEVFDDADDAAVTLKTNRNDIQIKVIG